MHGSPALPGFPSHVALFGGPLLMVVSFQLPGTIAQLCELVIEGFYRLGFLPEQIVNEGLLEIPDRFQVRKYFFNIVPWL